MSRTTNPAPREKHEVRPAGGRAAGLGRRDARSPAPRRSVDEVPGPIDAFALQRSAGNASVARLLSSRLGTKAPANPCGGITRLQRIVVGGDPPTALYEARGDKMPVAVAVSELLEDQGAQVSPTVVMSVICRDATIMKSMDDPERPLPVDQLARDVRSAVLGMDPHEAFLSTFRASFEQSGDLLLPLATHEETLANPVFSHFDALDAEFGGKPVMWRFTTTPSQEFVRISDGTDAEEVLRVVAAHSGGNDKSNADVKTLSFARNIGALIGTALSTGGDKHVLNIMDKAAYLYGIEIASLAGRGITAHPAVGRAISLYESEYVLIGTPGAPEVSLAALATIRLANPFRGKAAELLRGTSRQSLGRFKSVESEMAAKAPQVEPVTGLDAPLDPAAVGRIMGFARRAAAAGSQESQLVSEGTSLRDDRQLRSRMEKVVAYGRQLADYAERSAALRRQELADPRGSGRH